MSVRDYEIQHSFHWIQLVNFILGLFTKILQHHWLQIPLKRLMLKNLWINTRSHLNHSTAIDRYQRRFPPNGNRVFNFYSPSGWVSHHWATSEGSCLHVCVCLSVCLFVCLSVCLFVFIFLSVSDFLPILWQWCEELEGGCKMKEKEVWERELWAKVYEKVCERVCACGW